MKVFAHRGFSGKYPENTILAFQKAIDTGCYGIELDIHVTKDGQLAVIHDETVNRTTTQTGLVCDYTMQELQGFHAGAKFGDTFGFTPIPSLEEYFTLVEKHDTVTNIELKTNRRYYSRIEEMLVEKVKKHHLDDKVLFSSFNHLSIIRAKQLAPHIYCGFLVDHAVANIGELANLFNVECYHPDYKMLDDGIVRNCQEHHVLINTWTFNDMALMPQMKAWQVNAVISNYPDDCLKALA